MIIDTKYIPTSFLLLLTISAASEACDPPSDASRSVEIHFRNSTGAFLQRKDIGSWGIWSCDGSDVPPEIIEQDKTVYWSSESEGFTTGVEGYTNYVINNFDSKQAKINWNNPWWSSSEYSNSAPDDYKIEYCDSDWTNCTDSTGNDDDNAVLYIQLKPSS